MSKKTKEIVEDKKTELEDFAKSQEKKQEKLKKAVKDMEEKGKKFVLGEDGKFDKTDLRRMTNGALEVVAGGLGAVEHGLGWLREKLEKLEK